MPKAKSQDLRSCAIDIIEANIERFALNRIIHFTFTNHGFKICKKTMYNWWNRYTTLGHYNPIYNIEGRPRIMTEEHVNFLLNHLLTVNCKLQGEEMISLIFNQYDTNYTLHQMYNALSHEKYTHKLLELQAKEQDVEQRFRFRELIGRDQDQFRASMFVFVDEMHNDIVKARRKYGCHTYLIKFQKIFHH